MDPSANYSETWELFILKGNEIAFSRIYFDHYDLLYHYGIKYTSDKYIVEDSIQNVFSYLLKIRKSLRPVNNVRSYLLKSFRNQLFLDLKKQSKLSFPDQMPEHKSDLSNNIEQDITENETKSELNTAVKKCLSKLSDRQQEIIYLRYDCDLSYEEIATMLQISVDSCYKSVYRSIKTIRSEIEGAYPKGKSLLLWFVFIFSKRLP